MKIPFQAFNREYALLKRELLDACNEFFQTGMYILGEPVAQFERGLAEVAGSRYATGVAHGTDAITLAIRALGIPAGSEIVTGALSAYATILGIEQAGCKPVIVDIDPATGLMDTNLVESAVTTSTAALLPVHLYGQMVPMKPLRRIARRYGLKIIEDCAQAFGSFQEGRHAGTFGDAGAFSFYPTKNLGAYGDAGAVICKTKRVQETLMLMRNYGQKTRYIHSSWGLNSRLDGLQASLLAVKLTYADRWRERRRAIAEFYRERITGVRHLEVYPGNLHSYHLYVVAMPQRDDLQAHLAGEGIDTVIHYPAPLHRQPVFAHSAGDLPHVSAFCASILSLPCHAHLTDAEVEYIADSINRFRPHRGAGSGVGT